VDGDLFHGEQRREFRWSFLALVLPMFKLLEDGLCHFRADEGGQFLSEDSADDVPERFIQRGVTRCRRGAHG
jgi:hypothetical protein